MTMDAKKIKKNAVLKAQKAEDEELAKINQYTVEPLDADGVFTFRAVMGDNREDDRNFMPFSGKALTELAGMYPGKPVIKNHNARDVDGIVARVYDTELDVSDTEKNEDGESLTTLTAKCYMVDIPENAGLIAEIKAGIKKEVSTGFSCSSLVCSICGKDAVTDVCKHFPGREYDGKLCRFAIGGVNEVYELSFVTVPAQPRAGVTKSAEEDETPDDTETTERLRLELEALDL